MGTENLVRLLFYENLDASLLVIVRLGARVGQEGILANLVFNFGGFQFLLRLTHPSDLGMSVDDGWDCIVVDVTVTRLDKLSGSDTLDAC